MRRYHLILCGFLLQKDASIPQVNRIIKLMEPYTSVKSIFTDSESDVDIATVLSTFRDLCCVIWMLHNRDELSQAMRKKASQLHLHVSRLLVDICSILNSSLSETLFIM